MIPLDPSMSAKDNAQHYFDEYRKAQRAGSQLPDHIAAAETELAYLDQLRTQVEQADGFAAIESLRQEFEDHTGGSQEVGERPGSRSRRKEQRRVTGMPDAGGQHDLHRPIGPRERPGHVRHRRSGGHLAPRPRRAGIPRHHSLAAANRG